MIQTPWFKRALPFAIYMLFILISDLLEAVLPESVTATYLVPMIYPVKIIAVTAALVFFWKSYDELRVKAFTAGHILTAIGTGLLVFVLWIHADWDFATMGTPDIYDPRVLPGKWLYAFIAVRIFGASVIVPIFEELFWRSLILRYIIDPDFTSVKIGTFSWPSFLISAALFGAEHHYWLAGIVAGLLYNLLLYRSRNIWYCIIAHGITNLLLGIYVVGTGNWHFW